MEFFDSLLAKSTLRPRSCSGHFCKRLLKKCGAKPSDSQARHGLRRACLLSGAARRPLKREESNSSPPGQGNAMCCCGGAREENWAGEVGRIGWEPAKEILGQVILNREHAAGKTSFSIASERAVRRPERRACKIAPSWPRFSDLPWKGGFPDGTGRLR